MKRETQVTQKTSTILYAVDDHCAWIRINRPEFRNALSKDMWERLPQLILQCQSEGARVIVFSGQGAVFAAGADLTELSRLTGMDDAAVHWESIRSALNAVAACSVPTIAMVNGACVGGGCLLACACDIRIAAETARFSIPVAQLGIVLDEDNVARLLSLVGRGVASEMLFASSILTSERALQTGLVNQVVADVDLGAAVGQLVDSLKGNSGIAIKQLKESIARVIARGSVPEDQTAMIKSYISEEFRSRINRTMPGKNSDD